jgi:hypothetical protein
MGMAMALAVGAVVDLGMALAKGMETGPVIIREMVRTKEPVNNLEKQPSLRRNRHPPSQTPLRLAPLSLRHHLIRLLQGSRQINPSRSALRTAILMTIWGQRERLALTTILTVMAMSQAFGYENPAETRTSIAKRKKPSSNGSLSPLMKGFRACACA